MADDFGFVPDEEPQKAAVDEFGFVPDAQPEGAGLGRSFVAGFSVSDELDALTDTVVKPGMFDDLGKEPTAEQKAKAEAARKVPLGERVGSALDRASADYDRNLVRARADQQEARKANPKMAMLGSVTEALAATPFAPGGVVAQGALIGGGQALANSDRETLGQTVKDTAVGGTLGAGGGVLGKGVGAVGGKVIEKARGALGRGARYTAEGVEEHAARMAAKEADEVAKTTKKIAEGDAAEQWLSHPLTAKVDEIAGEIRKVKSARTDLVAQGVDDSGVKVHQQALDDALEQARLAAEAGDDVAAKAAEAAVKESRGALAKASKDLRAARKEADQAIEEATRKIKQLNAQKTQVMNKRAATPAPGTSTSMSKAGRQRFESGMEAKAARGRGARVEAEGGKNLVGAALGEAQKSASGFTGRVAPLVGGTLLGGPVGLAGGFLVGETARRALQSPALSRAAADALFSVAQKSQAVGLYLPVLTDGLEVGTAAGAREMLQRHLLLMEADPVYREEIEKEEAADAPNPDDLVARVLSR